MSVRKMSPSTNARGRFGCFVLPDGAGTDLALAWATVALVTGRLQRLLAPCVLVRRDLLRTDADRKVLQCNPKVLVRESPELVRRACYSPFPP